MEVAKLTLGDFHIFQENPKVYMSLSERIPGNLFRSQVPPRLARLSRTTKLAHLQCSCRKEIMVEIVLPPEVVHEVFKTYLSTITSDINGKIVFQLHETNLDMVCRIEATYSCPNDYAVKLFLHLALQIQKFCCVLK